MPIARLPARAVLAVTGADRISYLQGLVSNDVADAAPGRCVWSALLSPQGKWIADFFVFAEADRLLLDVEAAQAEAVAQRLTRFRLRAKVALAPTALAVHAGWDRPVPAGGIVAPDPRLAEAGWRLLADTSIDADADADAYDRHRIRLGLPDGSADMEADRSVLLEAGFDELHGVSWTKGCYMGQELTARTRYRGLVKRRLVPVSSTGLLPAPGTTILRNGVEAGVLRSVSGSDGLALLRLAALADAAALEADGVTITPRVPAWMRLPVT